MQDHAGKAKMLADYILLGSDHCELHIVPCQFSNPAMEWEGRGEDRRLALSTLNRFTNTISHTHRTLFASLRTEHPDQLAMDVRHGRDAPI